MLQWPLGLRLAMPLAQIPINDLLEHMRGARRPNIWDLRGVPTYAVAAYASVQEPSTQLGQQAKAWLLGALDVLHKKIKWEGETSKTDEARDIFESVDRQLVEGLVENGYLQQTPNISDIDMDAPGRAQARGIIGDAGQVMLKSTRQGDILEMAAKNLTSKSDTYRSLARWSTLLHEVSHCEFAQIAEPFQPSYGSLDKQAVDAINRWTTGRVFGDRGMYRDMLNENFADVYSAMMLIEVTKGNDEAMEVVKHLIEKRTTDQEQNEKAWLGGAGAPEKRTTIKMRAGWEDPKERARELARYANSMAPTLGVHGTAGALKLMIEDMPNWRGMAPMELRARALRLASDGLMDSINPKRRTLDGFPVGQAMRRGLGELPVNMMTIAGQMLSAVLLEAASGLEPEHSSKLGGLKQLKMQLGYARYWGTASSGAPGKGGENEEAMERAKRGGMEASREKMRASYAGHPLETFLDSLMDKQIKIIKSLSLNELISEKQIFIKMLDTVGYPSVITEKAEQVLTVARTELGFDPKVAALESDRKIVQQALGLLGPGFSELMRAKRSEQTSKAAGIQTEPNMVVAGRSVVR
jgi:hypothetical protein